MGLGKIRCRDFGNSVGYYADMWVVREKLWSSTTLYGDVLLI